MSDHQSADAALDGGASEDGSASDADELYVVYWVDEQGYGGSCEFMHASTLEEARERSSFGSGGVAHQRLLFEGSLADFREYVEEELEHADRFELVWD